MFLLVIIAQLRKLQTNKNVQVILLAPFTLPFFLESPVLIHAEILTAAAGFSHLLTLVWPSGWPSWPSKTVSSRLKPLNWETATATQEEEEELLEMGFMAL